MRERFHIGVARLWHEAHSFTPVITRLHDFQRKEWQSGNGAVDFYKNTNTEIGAVVDLMASEKDLDVSFSLCTAAPPGGVVPQNEMGYIHDQIIEGLRSKDLDGVYLSLHGAALSTGSLSPDTDLITEIRKLVGPDVPIAVSFDMHACINPEIENLVQVLTGYHTYPHVDMYDTGMRAMLMLLKSLREKKAMALHLRPIPLLLLSHMMRTEKGPMQELVALGEQIALDQGIEDASYFASFTYADTPYSSGMIAITSEKEICVSTQLDVMDAAFKQRKSQFQPDLVTADEGLEKAEAILNKRISCKPVALIDTADNPLSGGVGDTTGLLRAWLTCASHRKTVFCFFYDPDLVERCFKLNIDDTIHAQLGGRIMPEHGAPVELTMTIKRFTKGRFFNQGPMEKGVGVNIGRTVVLEKDNLQIIVTETCQSANDPAWCDLHGINLQEIELFLVKAKNHFRAGFEPLCEAIIDIEVAGPSPADLTLVPYKYVPRHYLI